MTSPFVSIPRVFWEDSRGDRIERSQRTRPATGSSPTQWLYIEGPMSAAEQIRMASVGWSEKPVPDQWKDEFCYCFEYAYGIPTYINRLVTLLTNEVLTLRTRQDVNAAVALDWYKIPEDGVDPMQWRNTPDGDLLYRSKYANHQQSKEALLARYLGVIEAHPLFQAAPTIVSVPGHNADGNSFGERLARKVGAETGKTVVQTTSNGPHVASKSGTARDYGDFQMPQALSGDVLVIDDVYRSGMSMAVVAHAARQAGAARVFGLVAARTLRN